MCLFEKENYLNYTVIISLTNQMETDWQIDPQLFFSIQIPLTKTEFELHSEHWAPLFGL